MLLESKKDNGLNIRTDLIYINQCLYWKCPTYEKYILSNGENKFHDIDLLGTRLGGQLE